MPLSPRSVRKRFRGATFVSGWQICRWTLSRIAELVLQLEEGNTVSVPFHAEAVDRRKIGPLTNSDRFIICDGSIDTLDQGADVMQLSENSKISHVRLPQETVSKRLLRIPEDVLADEGATEFEEYFVNVATLKSNAKTTKVMEPCDNVNVTVASLLRQKLQRKLQDFKRGTCG
jgi:hypothetical protein